MGEERIKRGPLISIFSHIGMGRRGRNRMGRESREDPSSQSSPTSEWGEEAGIGWGENQERTPHLNLLPHRNGEKRPEQDGERSKRGPLISIFSHIGMGRRGRNRMGRGAREDPSPNPLPHRNGERSKISDEEPVQL